jgi:thiol:disulfide interchange protein DsbA
MQRRHFSLALLAATSPLAARAATEGREYTRLQQPVPVAVPGKVEVMEFFGYWCPHCNALEPELEAWVRKLPADVNFRRMPVAFRPADELLQKLYFAIESLGLVDSLHRKVFTAIHGQRVPLRTEAEIADWAKTTGTDVPKLMDALKSFTVGTRVRQAKSAAEAVRLDSVPTLVVQGRYVTSTAAAGGHPQLMAVLDELVARARKG